MIDFRQLAMVDSELYVGMQTELAVAMNPYTRFYPLGNLI